MASISESIIKNGGAIKGDPGANPIDAIYDIEASTPAPNSVLTSAIVPMPAPVDAPDVVANAMVVNTDTSSKNKIILVGLGLGAAVLLLNKKSVGSLGAIGKKKKDKNLLPVLLIGGAAAYWYYTQNTTAPASATTLLQTGGIDVVTPPITADISNQATMATPATVLQYVPVDMPNDTTVYNLLYAYSTPWRYAVDRMTASERQELYQYVFGYIKRGYRLYAYPGTYYDGNYDATLYSQIAALSTKWNLGLLN